MLDKALNLKDKLPDLTKLPDSNLDDLQTELDTPITYMSNIPKLSRFVFGPDDSTK